MGEPVGSLDELFSSFEEEGTEGTEVATDVTEVATEGTEAAEPPATEATAPPATEMAPPTTSSCQEVTGDPPRRPPSAEQRARLVAERPTRVEESLVTDAVRIRGHSGALRPSRRTRSRPHICRYPWSRDRQPSSTGCTRSAVGARRRLPLTSAPDGVKRSRVTRGAAPNGAT